MKVTPAAHFLEEAEDSPIYAYYADLDKPGPTPELPAVYQEFADVFNEKAEDFLPPH